MRTFVNAFLFGLLALVALWGCGSGKDQEFNDKINYLMQLTGSINSVIQSDYSGCPASGDTADPLIRKICNVAQASTVEAAAALKAELSVYILNIQDELDAVKSDVAQHRTDIDATLAQLASMQFDLTALAGRMTSAEAAILALQNLTSSITGILAGNLISFEIGSENAAAGPLYETILRRYDKKRFNGYVEAYGPNLSLPNNPLDPTNGSPVVVVSMTAHGLVVGDMVELSSLVEGGGFSSGHLVGEFRVTAQTANNFTVSLGANATSGNAFGGNVGVARKVLGKGMSTLWDSNDPSDVAVRVTSLGTKRYNFLIRRLADITTAELCYDKTNNTALFATINAAPAGGSGNIVCK